MGNSAVKAFNCPNCGAGVEPDSPSCHYCGSSIAGRLCPACFEAISIAMKHCPRCGAEVEGPAPEPSGALICPRCRTKLAPVRAGRRVLNLCSQCGGLWVDKTTFQSICASGEEQEAVLGFRSEPVQAAADTGSKRRRAYVPCPECGKLMNPRNFSGCSGVVLDWCRDHGSWFDGSELQKVVTFIKDGGLRKAREREQLRLKEQQNRLRMQELRMAGFTLDEL